MAQYGPGDISDDYFDSDGYGFLDEPEIKYPDYQPSIKKKTENDLQEAIINGNLIETLRIVNNDLKGDVNSRLDNGWTPLMHACFHAQEKIVEKLLEMGVDPNMPSDSVTPVMATCSNSSAQSETIYNIVNMFIKKDCILNIGDKNGYTPLMRAISSGRVAVVQLLLDAKVNIEMRDRSGWTAAFWAVHHNQPEILELLIAHKARLNEVDSVGRKLMDIALSHDHENIIKILARYEKKDDAAKFEEEAFLNPLSSWHDYYPGVKSEERPTYSSEIPNLLYGMKCEQLTPIIMRNNIDLRTFLLLEEEDMIKMGIELPYERQRLKYGLKNFHVKGWKLSSVSGLYARSADTYSVVDCLGTLGNHLQQLYILEATLQYALRQYNRVQGQLKFEPPDSPVVAKIIGGAKKMITNMNSIRREIKIMKNVLIKISNNNPQPVDYIKERSIGEILLDYIPEVLAVCSLGFIVYHARDMIKEFIKK